MNKRGFTAVETILTSLLGATLLLSAIFVPNILLRQMKDYREVAEKQDALKIVVTAIRKDLDESQGRVRFDGEYLILKSSAYSFTEDGVYREIMGNSMKISDMPFKLEYYDDAFSLTSITEDESKNLKLEFNKEYSSFDIPGGVRK